ncbi:hypothetical protein ACIPY0_12335 [Paenarthrobacter nicotinovorans]|uniref:hypothetical protein n=1 Tax=Paenarthrobacter nicotinovorans TaxID=29320 RepID=UPI00380069DE
MSREQMKARLEGILAYEGFPWRRCVSTSGTSHGVVNSSGSVQVYGTSGYAAADFFASAPTDAQKLHAALDAVEALHQPVTVYELGDNGEFRLDPDGEEVEMATLCTACTGDSVLESIGDHEYDPLDYHDETHWPCPTLTAIRDALGEDQ